MANSKTKSQRQAPPPPPPWQRSIQYDPKNPNKALGEALLFGEWVSEDISMIRRVDNGETRLWVLWRPDTVPVLTTLED